MKITCNVIEDILPLYVEGLTSKDTNLLVEEHIKMCENCKKQLELAKNPSKIPMDTNIEPFKKVEKKLNRYKFQTIAMTITLFLIIAIISVAYLASPNYLPYSSDIMSVKEYEDGTIIVTFSSEVTGYNINQYKTDNNKGYSYHLTTWNTTWDKYILKRNLQSIILNPNGENVTSIYYYFTDGREDALIYGEDVLEGGGVITLPRLSLAYYLLLAIGISIILIILLYIYRKKDNIKIILKKLLLLPISYIISHLCIKGYTTNSYSINRDFFSILLLMIPIYLFFIFTINLYRKKHKLNS